MNPIFYQTMHLSLPNRAKQSIERGLVICLFKSVCGVVSTLDEGRTEKDGNPRVLLRKVVLSYIHFSFKKINP